MLELRTHADQEPVPAENMAADAASLVQSDTDEAALGTLRPGAPSRAAAAPPASAVPGAFDATVTAFAVNASEAVDVMFVSSSGPPFSVRVLAGETLALALPFPFKADEFQIRNRSDVDSAFVWYSVSGY